jgi:multiple sugar transport system permease protein
MVLVSMMIPYIVCTIPLFLLFRRLGWYDTYLGLIIAHLVITIPQSVWILLGFVQGIPTEIEDAGMVDGCSRLDLFIRIIFPLLRPGLIAASILSFILSWNNFSLALMLGGSNIITAPLALFNFIGEAGISWGGLTASATMMIIPTIIFTLYVQKYLTEGLLIGAIQ